MVFLFLKGLLSFLLGYFVDLVNEDKDSPILIVLLHTLDSQTPILQTFFQLFLRLFNIENVDNNLDILEDSFALDHEVVIHESVLGSAIPEVEGKVAHELEPVLFSLHRVADLVRLFGWIVCEDHRVHRRLSSPLAPH